MQASFPFRKRLAEQHFTHSANRLGSIQVGVDTTREAPECRVGRDVPKVG